MTNPKTSEAAALVMSGESSASEAARRYKLHVSTVTRAIWRKQHTCAWCGAVKKGRKK